MGQKRISNPVRGLRKRLYNVEEAAEYLGRSVWGVREIIYSGQIDCVRIGRRVQLDIRDMDKWIEENKIRYED